MFHLFPSICAQRWVMWTNKQLNTESNFKVNIFIHYKGLGKGVEALNKSIFVTSLFSCK